MSTQASGGTRSAVACPFCGLACDDLSVAAEQSRVSVIANGCARSVALFRASVDGSQAQPSVEGRPAALPEAVARAAAILGGARQPLIGGFGADVAGVRAALRMADRVGAVVDHMSRGLSRNLAVLQDSGWIATTFAEVQNRADLVIVAGTDIVSRFPRFFERLLGQRESLFGDDSQKREIVYLGAKALAADASRVIDCSNLGEAFAALRTLVAGKPLQAKEAGGVPVVELGRLAERMREARYGVVVWVAADLDYPHAELAIQAMCAVVADLNQRTRFAVLPLSGTDGDMTANQVTVWQTGFPLRTSFGRGSPEYDPYHFACERLLARGEADALLWISAFDAERTPPVSDAPTIVLGRGGMRFANAPAVSIPVATPGVHHAGHFFRGDNVVAMRLSKLVDSPLPAVADILGQIEAAL